jgi:hypothetical protein
VRFLRTVSSFVDRPLGSHIEPATTAVVPYLPPRPLATCRGICELLPAKIGVWPSVGNDDFAVGTFCMGGGGGGRGGVLAAA